MFRQPEQGGHDMTAEVPFPRCQQVCALAGDGVVFKEGAPFPWYEGATGFPRCMLLGPQQLRVGAFFSTPYLGTITTHMNLGGHHTSHFSVSLPPEQRWDLLLLNSFQRASDNSKTGLCFAAGLLRF